MNDHYRMALFALAGLCCASVYPQTWCTSGSQWWYDYWGLFGNQTGVAHVQYDGDTTVAGETAQLLRVTVNGYDHVANAPFTHTRPTVLTKSTADQVFYWDGAQWRMLFNLAAQSGASWALSGPLFSPSTVTVGSTGTTNIAGEDLRYSVVSFDPPFQGLAVDTILERIGYLNLFMDPNATLGLDGPVQGLRCFQDDDIFYSTGIAGSCDFELGTPEFSGQGGPSLFPNPGQGSLFIDGLAPAASYRVTMLNAQGAAVRNFNLARPEFPDLSALDPGIYTLRVSAKGIRPVYLRWVKH